MLRKLFNLFKKEKECQKTGLYNVLLMNGNKIKDVKVVVASSKSNAKYCAEQLYGGIAKDAQIFQEI